MKWLSTSVILVILIGAGLYLYTHNQSSSLGTSTTTPPVLQASLEATTTTYTNNIYHFAFDYPKTFGTSTVSFSGQDVHDPTDANARFEGTLKPVGLTIEVDAKASSFSQSYFNDQFTAEKKERANANFTLSTTTTNIGGIPAFTVEGIGKGVKEEEILLEHGSYIYSIGFSFPSNSSQSSVIQSVLDTFRFTE